MYQGDSIDESEPVQIGQLNTGDILQNRFQLQAMIGEGSFGQVFKVVDLKTNDHQMAIKVEDYTGDTCMLEREIKVLMELRLKPGFPEIKFYGQERGFIYCIMGLLGRNLESLLKKCGGQFTMITVLRLAIQIMSRMETFHSCRLIHRDIKPDNFVLGVGTQRNILHLLDFGLSKYYQNAKGEHISFAQKQGLIGTARYASVNAHDEREQSRRDDLESVGYILIYMATGSLPWMNLKIENKEQKYRQIHQMKRTIKIERLCEGLPLSFSKYFKSIRALKFTDKPDYKQLKQYFQSDLDDLQKNKQPVQYDWENLPEYQQKKKHQTVHIMQPTSSQLIADEKPELPKLVQRARLHIDTQKINEMDQKLKEISQQKMQSPKKQLSLTVQSPNRKSKKPVIINVIEAEPETKINDQTQNPLSLGKNNLLPPLNLENMKPILDSYPQTLNSSRKINYEQHSEDVESENNLPIWDISQALTRLPSGIKRPKNKRRDQKSYTQVQALKNIQETFIAPVTMHTRGDETFIQDCDE